MSARGSRTLRFFPGLVFLLLMFPLRASADRTGSLYNDSAIIGTNLRLRVDAVYGINTPDLAEYYLKRQDATGPFETSLDYQELNAYFEQAFSDRLSVFAEQPLRFCNPTINENVSGVADLRAGVRFGLFAAPDESQYVTFQLRTYIPTGLAGTRYFNGVLAPPITTGHFSIEPAILYYQRLSDRLTLEIDLRDWIPIGGSTGDPVTPANFAGNTLQYGFGLTYQWLRSDGFGGAPRATFSPVFETVGWTVLDGLAHVATSPDGSTGLLTDVSGDTIVNFKASGRLDWGRGHSLAVGYGWSATKDHWYSDIVRFEYRLSF
jgi:hypothetical protein